MAPTSKFGAKRPGDSEQATGHVAKAKAPEPASGLGQWGDIAQAANRHHAKVNGANEPASKKSAPAKAKAGKFTPRRLRR